MRKIFNFSAGPAMLPEWVLKKAQEEMLEYGNSGQSVMEMSHRSKDYEAIIQTTEKDLRELMNIPDNYKVLFLQGGASLQFSMIPLNCAKNKVQIIQTGEWTKKATVEHQKLVKTEIIASSETDNFSYIPKVTRDQIDPEADYLYICQNNTIFGTRYAELPDCGNVPLVSDVSSMILSEPLDISKYGILFAGSQKNMGPSGMCVVIIREDMLINDMSKQPSMLNYRIHIDNASMFNTPPTYSIYMCGLVCKWLKEEIGGLEEIAKINKEKAAILYDFLDNSKLFKSPVCKENRSLMNVTFVTGNPELDKLFIKEASNNGLINLAGHRLIGGMRASIYNAMPIEGVKKLVEVMKEFEAQHG